MDQVEPNREHVRSCLARDLDARAEILFALLHGSFARGEAFRDGQVHRVIRENLGNLERYLAAEL